MTYVEKIDPIDEQVNKEYEYGFSTNIEAYTLPPGLDESVIEKISQFKNEPQWLLDWRLKAYRKWLKMTQPDWHQLDIEPIDYQAVSYYSVPKPKLNSMDEVCLLYTSPSPRDSFRSRMPSSA